LPGGRIIRRSVGQGRIRLSTAGPHPAAPDQRADPDRLMPEAAAILDVSL
jgi:hypothetical protein